MNALVEYWDREAVIHPNINCEERRDIVDDVLRRLDNVEADVSALRKDVSKLQVDVGIIASNYATTTDVAEVKTMIKSLETKMLYWYVATNLTALGLAFSAAKYLH